MAPMFLLVTTLAPYRKSRTIQQSRSNSPEPFNYQHIHATCAESSRPRISVGFSMAPARFILVPNDDRRSNSGQASQP
jgi:hypothetical protein